MTEGVSRRGFLKSAAAAAGAVAIGGLGGYGVGNLVAARSSSDFDPARVVPFHGAHQAGIATPAQDRLAFAAFDVTAPGRDELRSLLRSWTDAARRMTAGSPVGPPRADEAAPLAPPVDTGEAFDLPAASLTVTIGFGPSLFDGRFGLASLRPSALQPLPALPGDQLDPAYVGGDLCIQACADDPQVAFHAVRNLTRIGRGRVVMRWFQLGFGRTSTTSRAQDTPRNLMGFKDGTNNIVAEDRDAMDRFVWTSGDGTAPWMDGGSYLVARRIRMLIESWDRAPLDEQQNIFGRNKLSGAPLGGSTEHESVNLAGSLIPADAHIRLAAPATNDGQRLLRRGYSYTDGIDPRTGQLDAGLFFICFQADPMRQFVPIQRRLGANDALTEYIKHVGSALFACPRGVADASDYWGSGLL